jgi:hypothetical protein
VSLEGKALRKNTDEPIVTQTKTVAGMSRYGDEAEGDGNLVTVLVTIRAKGAR